MPAVTQSTASSSQDTGQQEARANRFAMEIVDYIKSIELPRGFDEEGERLSPEKDQPVDRFCTMLSVLVEEIGHEQPSEPTRDNITTTPEIPMSMMEMPFAYLDLTTNCSKLRELAHRIYNLTDATCLSCIYKRNPEETTMLTTATLYYLYKCEFSSDSCQRYPQIISHSSQLSYGIPYVACLLEKTQALAHEKGLLLLESLLKPVNAMEPEFYTLLNTSKTIDYLYKIMVYSDSRSCRRQAYQMFESICNLLPIPFRVEIFEGALTNEEVRSNLKGACVDLYRKNLAKIDRNSSIEYSQIGGQNLVRFLELSIEVCLPSSKLDDILENCDLIIAVLTLLRYLKLRKTPTMSISISEQIEQDYLRCDKLKVGFFLKLTGLLTAVMRDLQRQIDNNVVEANKLEMLEWTQTRFELMKFTLVNTSNLYGY